MHADQRRAAVGIKRKRDQEQWGERLEHSLEHHQANDDNDKTEQEDAGWRRLDRVRRGGHELAERGADIHRASAGTPSGLSRDLADPVPVLEHGAIIAQERKGPD